MIIIQCLSWSVMLLGFEFYKCWIVQAIKNTINNLIFCVSQSLKYILQGYFSLLLNRTSDRPYDFSVYSYVIKVTYGHTINLMI